MQQVTVPASPTSARDGRMFLSSFCRTNDVPADVVDDAVLLVSELVGNTYLHARSSARICASYGHPVLHVEVADECPAPPRRRQGGPDATGGRGLLILESLATSWGVRQDAAGKVVWFDVTAA